MSLRHSDKAAAGDGNNPTTALIQIKDEGFYTKNVKKHPTDLPQLRYCCRKAYTPSDPAPTALPALKPNQPNRVNLYQ